MLTRCSLECRCLVRLFESGDITHSALGVCIHCAVSAVTFLIGSAERKQA